MSDSVLTTRQINSSEKLLRAKFAEQFAGQAVYLFGLARQLIPLELAVPDVAIGDESSVAYGLAEIFQRPARCKGTSK